MPKNTPTRIIDSQRTRAVSFLGGSGTAAGVTDHGLLLGLNDDDHIGYLRADGTRALTGNLLVNAGVTIDGVDISAHAADPDAHHARATAGSGISVTGQQVSLAAGATYQFIGTGGSTAAGWRNVSELAGDGLAASAGVLAVGVANTGAAGLSVETDQLRLTSNSNPGAAAAVLATDASGYMTVVRMSATDRLRGPILDTAAGTLTLSPNTDVLLQPASNLVKAQPGVAIQAYNYASQVTGWRVTADGQGDFRYLYTDELHAKSFIADLEQALAGGQIISKSVAVLGSDFTAPAAGGTATLNVKDLPSAPNMAVFQSGDYVRLRSFSRAAGSLTIANCWGVVTSYVNEADDTQTWTFTRSTSTNAGTMAAGTVIAADAIVLDYGTTGNGFYEVNAIDGAYGVNSPYWQIVSWSTHPATGQTVRARGGNLYGIFAQANEYGLYAGSGTANTDSYLRISNNTVRLNNVPLQLWSGANQTVNISSTGTDVWIGPNSADKRLTWDGSTLSVTGTINVIGGNAATVSNVTGASNLVKNSSFELDSNGDGLADNFTIYNNDAGAVPTTAARGYGNRSTWFQRISWTGTNLTSKGIYFSTGTHKAGVPYVITFWCRTNTAVTITLAHNVQPTKVNLAWPTADTSWQFFAVKCTWATDNTDPWYVTINYGQGIANGYIDFDNVMVYEGDQIVPYQSAPTDVVGYGGLINMPAAPGTTPGLYLTSTNMGYFDGSNWKTWMASTGQFYFGGSTGASLRWDGTRLSGYDSGNIEQWYANAADGKLYAGAGNVMLDRKGVRFLMIDDPTNGFNELKWSFTPTALPEFRILSVRNADNSVISVISTQAQTAGKIATLTIAAFKQDNTAGQINFLGYVNMGHKLTVPTISNTGGAYYSDNAHIFFNLAGTAYKDLAAGNLVAYGGGLYSSLSLSFLTTEGAALPVRTGSVLVSSDYNHNTRVPTNGIYSLGYVHIGSYGTTYHLDVGGEARVTGAIRSDTAFSLPPVSTPAASATYVVLFVDSADGKLKYRLRSGDGSTVRTLSYT